jgi:spore coat polysaccharide biosynthesis predicted glycosyltransferase SpsG
MADRPVDCDYLLNWNPTGFTKKDYDSLVNQGAELLLGSKWFVFSPSIIAAKTQIRNRDTTIKNILISYGGSDPTCETEKALTAIKQLTHPNLALTVIFAGDKERANLIESDCHKSGFEFYSFTNKIAELTVMADLVLGSGGVSLMERLYLGTPTLVTKVSENQGPTINFLTQIGAIEYLGDSATVTPEVIKEKLQFYLSNSSRLDAQIQIGETLFSRNVEIHPLLQQITKLEQ